MGLIEKAKGAPVDYGGIDERGQHINYPVLPEADRKAFVRPVRLSYKHLKCGVVTSMGQGLAETYAADPTYYTHTFCVECRTHLPVAEFVWVDDGLPVGS